MAVGLSTMGVKMKYKSSGETYTELPNMQSTPSLKGEEEKIDVTTLTDTFRRYIDGVKDYGNLDFVFLYDANQTDSSFNKMKAVEGEDIQYKLELPDKSAFEFSAAVKVGINEMEVNSGITFTASFSLSSDVEYIPAE